MTVSDLLDRLKGLLIVSIVGLIAVPLILHIVTPEVFYVKDDGLLTIYAKGLDEPVVLRCPRFRVSTQNVKLTGHYANCKTIVSGQFMYVLMRGLSTVGPVSIEVLPEDRADSIVVSMESKDHPIVPQALLLMGRTKLRKTIVVDDGKLVVDVVWHGAVDTSLPRLQSVECNGEPMAKRISDSGII